MSAIRQSLTNFLSRLIRPVLRGYITVEQFNGREAVLLEQVKALNAREAVLQEQVEALNAREAVLQEQVEARIGSVTGLREEIEARFTNTNAEIKQLSGLIRAEIDNALFMLRQEDQNLRYDISTTLRQETGNRTEAVGASITRNLMHSRLLLAQKNFHASLSSGRFKEPERIQSRSFEEYLEQFKQLHPHLYDLWASINLGVTIDIYRDSPENSCGVDTRENARLFRGFAAPYLQGRVLDVGCGPYAVPNYLKGYPPELISGLDPLEPFEPHPFEFVRGFAEFLPWPDTTFDVLIAATSLDHVISLDQALQEIYRVLKPDGIFITWDWFGENTRPYNPSEQAPELIDNYHFFNFSETWFEKTMLEKFSIEEKIRLFGEYSSDRFYALRRKG